MSSSEGTEGVGADLDSQGWSATRSWVEKGLSEAERIVGVERLRGGWTSEMRRLDLCGPEGRQRSLVLRSFVKPFFVQHAEGLLTREATILSLLGDTDVPAARLEAVDATAEYCDHPSLLMTLLPGTVRLSDQGADDRADLLARQLVRIHQLPVTAGQRPRTYQAWTSPERVTLPAGSEHPELWQRAVDVIRREPPAYQGRFLHRDFHPGNVLFTGAGAGAGAGVEDDLQASGDLRISGVVDWVETSWGPVDLDVAHCSTALALLHGIPAGMDFADRYVAAGGTLADDGPAHLYWRLLDALGYAPDAEKLAVPWRELGRVDLTAGVLAQRLEGYIGSLLGRYA
ncbi:phosphotransferase family protein [Streptomyces turgidiscabies]|uniref:Phosphotransferase enzyme family protein n=1 Tax=Streptomyces turgidiscabies (strain Car8) TaxID=698760 RepID=L7F6L7_STRT8|nr:MULTISPECIES: phosphotransferase [Streptomyces]ELP66932.1 phosphotransferase enzyme family protein [Streptomyces turgidiscabies Car8]MDX3493056.1 phosphotransferase [Streptomyces turgidiscabies]GAQ77239.1 phosphotransferase enzyme family protein [Streptomyces turgidiscabies]